MQTFEHALPIGAILENRYKIEFIPGAARMAMGEHSQSISAIISMGYAPSEQYTTRGKQGSYTDLYAVGEVLYKLITGGLKLLMRHND